MRIFQKQIDTSDAEQQFGQQPRGKQLPAVISEFKEIVTIPRHEAIQRKCKILRDAVQGGETSSELAFVPPQTGKEL